MEKEVIEHTSSKTIEELDEAKEIENMKKIEAALFIAARFLNLQELVMLTDVNPLMLKELLDRIIEKYNQDDSAIEIIVKDNMWKMDVRQEYVSMINKLATGSSEFTKAEQETLAVIAYKQPVKQSVIIKIRGNKAYEHIRKFRDIGLVKSKRIGHTLELNLSDDFFEYFHLQKKGNEMVLEKNNEGNEDLKNINSEGDIKIRADENNIRSEIEKSINDKKRDVGDVEKKEENVEEEEVNEGEG